MTNMFGTLYVVYSVIAICNYRESLTPKGKYTKIENGTLKCDHSKRLIALISAWASADFFPGEGKIFQGGGKNILFA